MSIETALIGYNEQKYIEYIIEHRTNVSKAWNEMKNNQDCIELISNTIISNIDETIKLIDELVQKHDLSKHSKEEFHAYRKEFFPITKEEKENNKDEFDKAWKHHYTNNLHHWNWWYESGNMENMPLTFVVEMICDWEAMGYKFGNNSKEYYESAKERIHLGESQRQFAEALMNIICN